MYRDQADTKSIGAETILTIRTNLQRDLAAVRSPPPRVATRKGAYSKFYIHLQSETKAPCKMFLQINGSYSKNMIILSPRRYGKLSAYPAFDSQTLQKGIAEIIMSRVKLSKGSVSNISYGTQYMLVKGAARKEPCNTNL